MKSYTSKSNKNYVEKSWQMGKVISNAYMKTLVNKNKNTEINIGLKNQR